MSEIWSGTFVGQALGVHLQSAPGSARPLEDLVGLALRRNPKRAHLLVSNVLGKHVPTSPAVIRSAGSDLGTLVALVLGPSPARPPIVIGFAETATSLGQLVADQLGAYGLHSTRRTSPEWTQYESFQESHSHATDHALFPRDPSLLNSDGPVVLVDDELSTGRTALALIRALHRRSAHSAYVIAALIDVRDESDRQALQLVEQELGVPISVVALAVGSVELPDAVLTKGTALVNAMAESTPFLHSRTASEWSEAVAHWPDGLPRTSRHGFDSTDRAALLAYTQHRVDALIVELKMSEAKLVLVLGTEELMYAPLCIAEALEQRLPGVAVRFGTTTRSPVLANDSPGYAIRSAITFNDPEGTDQKRFVYNLLNDEPYDHLLLITDSEAAINMNGTEGILGALSVVARHSTFMVLPNLPAPLTGPAFGSYRSDDVQWLLQDLRRWNSNDLPKSAKRTCRVALVITPSLCQLSISPTTLTSSCSMKRLASRP